LSAFPRVYPLIRVGHRPHLSGNDNPPRIDAD
jgi:hypothetical protein